MNKISDRIKFIRISTNLTQTKFGQKLGVSRDVINNIENSRVEPKALFLNHLCNSFDIAKEWLLNGTGDMYNSNNNINHLEIKEIICENIMRIDNIESLTNIKNLSDLLLNFEK
ncbi:helix-turn-helix domain-containing protein [Clostridium tertium]|uniref:helix-turn-helix domain-containing protein n=1 Tax=Clostridium tertium TaxID=1559 RepID=UPI0035620D81